ncbi:hypothetical protein PV11_03989 [Exophiala sideris]|uniref:Uncharacterized protein n=1 Tax=Exophiala sideris TaxID=1016849 RepID=A0A0D1Z4N6_9EURO|nr:hypothetical protein PV11_03989 [Exophiala sideris]
MSTLHLLGLPSEIRNHIWDLAFGHQHVVATPNALRVYQLGCQACESSRGQCRLDKTWQDVFRPLLTCKQIFHEAISIIQSSTVIHLGEGMKGLDDLICPGRCLPSINDKIRRLVLWVHIQDDNRFHWSEGIEQAGIAFSSLDELIIHAHMRPPDSYERLTDAVDLATPTVRLGTRRPKLKITLHFDYAYHEVMFDSPYLGEITTHDSLEQHELVLRDLIEDDAFVEAALSREDDEQAATAALLRVARAHEQPWFEKLNRRRQERLRLREQMEAMEASGNFPPV